MSETKGPAAEEEQGGTCGYCAASIITDDFGSWANETRTMWHDARDGGHFIDSERIRFCPMCGREL